MTLNTKKSYFVLPEIESSLLTLSKQTGTYTEPKKSIPINTSYDHHSSVTVPTTSANKEISDAPGLNGFISKVAPKSNSTKKNKEVNSSSPILDSAPKNDISKSPKPPISKIITSSNIEKKNKGFEFSTDDLLSSEKDVLSSVINDPFIRKSGKINTTFLNSTSSSPKIIVDSSPPLNEFVEPTLTAKTNSPRHKKPLEDSQRLLTYKAIEEDSLTRHESAEIFEKHIRLLHVPYEIIEEKSAGELDYETEAIAASFTVASLIESSEDMMTMSTTNTKASINPSDDSDTSAFDIIETVYPSPTAEVTPPFELDSYILETAFKENTFSNLSLFESPSLLLHIENIAFSETVKEKNRFLTLFHTSYSDLKKSNERLAIDS
ncbi:hypothetical protein HOH45_08120 [bacterium]|jgi:hypothetical protein|nr:hypothetical protein [bacterium]